MYSVPLASSVKRRHDHGHDNDHIDARKKTRGAPISDEGSRDLKALLDDDVTPTTATHSTRAVTVRAGSVVTFLHPQDTTKVIKRSESRKTFASTLPSRPRRTRPRPRAMPTYPTVRTITLTVSD